LQNFFWNPKTFVLLHQDEQTFPRVNVKLLVPTTSGAVVAIPVLGKEKAFLFSLFRFSVCVCSCIFRLVCVCVWGSYRRGRVAANFVSRHFSIYKMM
jgi:hypothetical protein